MFLHRFHHLDFSLIQVSELEVFDLLQRAAPQGGYAGKFCRKLPKYVANIEKKFKFGEIDGFCNLCIPSENFVEIKSLSWWALSPKYAMQF